MKKALALLYSPKTLVDFIWYYHTFGQEYAWDVICVPCGGKVLIEKYCINSGVFSNVYVSEPIYKSMSMGRMAVLFGKMTIAWITKKKSQFVQSYFKKYVENLDYDLHLVPSEFSALCGFLISLSSEVETVILEDGLADYVDKSRRFLLKYGFNLKNISSYFLSIMGYGYGVGQPHYINKPSSLCIKYVAHPEWMLYRKYKEIKILGDLSNTNIDAWKKCLQKTFHIDKNRKFVGDIILFTAPLADLSDMLSQKIADDVVQYIIYKYNPKKIYIKRHHRDIMKYNFPQTVEVDEIEKDMPGELILNLIQCKKHIYTYPSTMLVNYKEYSNCEILKFRKLIIQKKEYEVSFEESIQQIKFPYQCINIL